MKQLAILLFVFLSIQISAQFNCIDGDVYTCDGFVNTQSIYGNLDNSNNSISSYTCNGTEIGSGLGLGLNDNYGQDDIYIFNSIGESGAFNSMSITLNMDINSDLDIIAITSDCSYECFSSDSYVLNGTGSSETITLNWEDETTIIIVVEAYHLDGGGDYDLQFQYNTFFNYCSYFPSEGQPIECVSTNTVSGAITIPFCLTTFPTDCPPEVTYHEGKGPFYANEQVYQFKPSAFNGNISISLNAGSGVEAFLYHRQFIGVDATPLFLLDSGTNFLSANYSMVSDFDVFYLIIDAQNSGTYPFTFTIEYPGCAPVDPCGECFTYVETANNSCKIDNSLTPPCGTEEWYYSSYPNGGNTTTFTLDSNNEVQFPIAGDYLVCYDNYCSDLPTDNLQSNSTLPSTCCIVVSIGENCNEPPVAHFTGSSNIQGSNIGHVNFFNSSTSLNADYYSWHWGDGQTNTTSQTNISHDYPLEPNPLTLCMVASNECGMSKYCITYDSYGDSDVQFDCGLPFSPYQPPAIYPTVDGNLLTISGLSFACGADEITFDPGDGGGEYSISCNGINYTYSENGKYLACIRIKFPCFTICFCYTVDTNGFNCSTDPFLLECNESGDLAWSDSTNPNTHAGISTLSNVVDNHNICTTTYDGWDETNTLAPNIPFSRNEVVYKIKNPEENHLGEITIDLIMDQPNLDLDVFVYGICEGNGQFSNCIASSTHDNSTPNGKRDAILLSNIPAFDEFYVIVDGQSNAPNFNEGNYTISYTCGSICTKYSSSIQCGQSITSTTINRKNEVSYYCNCENESDFGPAGNYGPEQVYRFDLLEASTVTIDLETLTPSVDLELYLLNECSASFCNRTSRRPAGQDEQIQKTLSAGTYYIVVEGFAGDAGDFKLTVSGCETNPVPIDDCDLINQYTFQSYNDQDLIPTDDNSGLWEYGICYEEDLNDNMLDAVIEDLNGNKRLVLNSGNYFYSDVALKYETATSGIRKLEWDLTVQYVDDDLYGGRIKIYDQTTILDFTQFLEIVYGHDSNGNYAELVYKSFNLVNGQEIKLADISPIRDYNGNNPIPTFNVEFSYNLDNGQFTLWINNTAIYTGYFGFESSNQLINRTINFAVDDEQDYMEIDNIRVYECEDCSITYNDDCNFIFPTYINQNNTGNITVTLDQSGIIEEDISSYEVLDETTGEVIDLESLSYDNCIPGRSYKFCIIYYNEDGCPKACCYRITIPLNCSYFLPYYTGDESQISYALETNNLPSGYDVEQWQIDGVVTGTSNSTTIQYDSPQSSFVCCLIYDPFSKQHILCCYNLCAQIATNCNAVNAQLDPTTGTYSLSVSGAIEILSWNIDSPANLSNNGLITNPNQFNPSDFGISPGQTILVSVRYKDASNCIKVCCIEITIPIPQGAVIFDINDACGGVGSTIEVPVLLYNFNEVGIVGFELFSADFTKVRLDGIVNKAPQFSSLDFNTVNNKIILGWDDPQGGNISVADGTKMFDIQVTILEDFDDAILLFGSALEVLGNTALEATVNPGNICLSEFASISGNLSTYTDTPLADIEVTLNNGNTTMTFSDALGNYDFQEVDGNVVEIEPYNNSNIRQGVSISDVALIRKHYLQVSTLDNDYKMIAADVNKSGSITNTDVALARRIYLQVITDEIPNNTSWRFIPSSLDISLNPLDSNLDESIVIANPSGMIMGQDFTGIKVGDVNNSVGFTKSEKEQSSRLSPLRFIVEDIKVQQGTMVTIPLLVEDFEQIALFGFEILWDSEMLDLMEMTSELDGFSAQNYNILDGKAILGWDEPNGGALDYVNGTLIEMKFEINSDAMGTTALSFANVEVLDGNFAEVETEFDSGVITVETTSTSDINEEYIRVYPNPFSQNLTVDVSSLGITKEIEIRSIEGKLIWKHEHIENKLITVPDHIFPHPGVFLIKVSSMEGKYVKKVMKI
ncbi:MAG: T9SS type A sorting domain-containing protein [Saprospiraceae bacterium]|nr:T9SS type A sorting domain-containing protein [Saprospiraceae bacterium]